MAKQVYRIEFRVATEGKYRKSFVYAEDAERAKGKLAARFADAEIDVTSISVQRGKFVVGCEDRTLPPADV